MPRGAGRRARAHRHARAPARAGPGAQGDDRHRHARRPSPADSPPSRACRTPIRSTTTPAITEFILKKAAEAGLARVYPIGAVSLGSKGEQLAEIGELKAAGCVAISDDGQPVATALLMRRALEYAGDARHAGHRPLRGSVAQGRRRRARGLRRLARSGCAGIPGAAESMMVERDISLAELTGGHVHVAHMSARQSLRAVRDGKARGVQRDLRGRAAPLHAHRRRARRAGAVRHQRQDEPAAARGGRSRRDARGPRRRQRRRDRHRSRAASRRREDASSSTARRSGSSGSRRPCRSCSIGWCTPGGSRCRGWSSCCR